MRSIKVFLDCGLEVSALQTIFQMVCQTDFVSSAESADVILVDEVSKIRPVYNPEKKFVVISEQGEAPFSDGNVKVMTPNCPTGELLGVLVEAIESISHCVEEKIDSEPEEQVDPEVIINEAPWVLIVAEEYNNRLQARMQLGEAYNLTVVKGYDEALIAIANRLYDYALIDLYLPLAHSPLSTETTIRNLEAKIPYGLAIVFDTCRGGVNSCLISNRKLLEDPLASIFQNYVEMHFVINGKRARFCYDKALEDGSRDWCYILSRLTQVNL